MGNSDIAKFFSIEGIWVNTNAGRVPEWSQPVIHQPEIGILGMLTRRIGRILYFLTQAKMEPGNIGTVQLAPTVQATHSNFTLVHHGSRTPYLDYFLRCSPQQVLVDSLQSEQGARFFRKRNRNMIIEVDEDVPILEGYCWLTLGQISRLLKSDNTVNMDARTVLACSPFSNYLGAAFDPVSLRERIRARADIDLLASTDEDETVELRVLRSAVDTKSHLHTFDGILSWFTALKVKYELEVERIPLKYVKGWTFSPDEIAHESGRYFSVIAARIEAGSREVQHWTQPLVKPREKGIVAFIVKEIQGVLHFLMQAKVEPGNFDIVEMAPTVQCITGSYIDEPEESRPRFLDLVLSAPEESIRYSTYQSEEGGRFYKEENHNVVVEVGDDFPEEVPENYIWLTMSQIKQFAKLSNYVNVQARCLLSTIGFI